MKRFASLTLYSSADRIGLTVYERVGDRLLGMIRDNLERDQVTSSSSTTNGNDNDEGEDEVIVSEAERNRLLIEKMSQGQPERKRSYSASKASRFSSVVVV